MESAAYQVLMRLEEVPVSLWLCMRQSWRKAYLGESHLFRQASCSCTFLCHLLDSGHLAGEIALSKKSRTLYVKYRCEGNKFRYLQGRTCSKVDPKCRSDREFGAARSAGREWAVAISLSMHPDQQRHLSHKPSPVPGSTRYPFWQTILL